MVISATKHVGYTQMSRRIDRTSGRENKEHDAQSLATPTVLENAFGACRRMPHRE
jgi:hypothetical protein